jgi:N-acetylglucosaminyldiphosphoundecaprenol N-acetyl-beta-D-mannosaminyltransferase
MTMDQVRGRFDFIAKIEGRNIDFAPHKGLQSFRVLGARVHAVDAIATELVLQRFLRERQPRQVATANVDFLRLAAVNPSFQELLNTADLVVADGRPLVWLARYLGLKSCGRVTGPDIIDMCSRASARNGYKIFLLGGEEGAAEAAKRSLEERFPGVHVCGVFSPKAAPYPFPAGLDLEIEMRIREIAPDILFVGFGCPKQELWIREKGPSLGIPVSVGVGGSFNFLSGAVARAPRLLQGLGLEWAYRLYREPGRLWRRYLRDDLPFVLNIVMREIGARLGILRHPVMAAEDWKPS